MANATADLDSVVAKARAVYPEAPLYLLGHSMGGAIVLSYTLACTSSGSPGSILSGPLAALEGAVAGAFAHGRAHVPVGARADALPLLPIDPVAASAATPPSSATYQSTIALVHHGKLPARTVVELAGAIEAVPRSGRGDHRADADHVRDRRRPLPAAGQRDAVAANRLAPTRR